MFDEAEKSVNTAARLLGMYDLLSEGTPFTKKEMAEKFNVNERSIQRDFALLRNFLEERNMRYGIEQQLLYDRMTSCYRLEPNTRYVLNNAEIQYMYGGTLQKVILHCDENSLEAVMDRLPTSKIISKDGSIYTIRAEVLGKKGLDIWLNGQKDINLEIKQ